MLSDCKYINYDGAIFIFPSHINHVDVASHQQMDKEKIEGAGFVAVGDQWAKCYGSSVSLGVCADEKLDSYLVNRMLFWYKIEDYVIEE